MTNKDELRMDSTCLGPDQIVGVGGALGSDPLPALAHLLECPECREVLDTVGAVQAAYAPRLTPTEAMDVAERVIDRIAPDRSGAPVQAAVRPPGNLLGWGIGAANWVLAAAAGFFGVMIVASGNTASVSLQGAMMAAGLTGLLPIVQGAWFRMAPKGG